jgi:hypothetical protein
VVMVVIDPEFEGGVMVDWLDMVGDAWSFRR